MPQLDTSTWFITISSMVLTLFFVFQLKVSKYYFMNNPESKHTLTPETPTPWEKKWTKICSPLSLPLQ